MSEPKAKRNLKPLLPMFRSETEHRNHIKASAWIRNPPQRFLRWLEKKGIPRESIIVRNGETKGDLYRRICPKTKRWLWKDVRYEATKELKALELTGLNTGPLHELVLWLMEPLLADLEGGQKTPPVVTEEELASMEFLPDFLRWVILHPLLPVTEDDEKETDRYRARRYVQMFPCPNEAARTMLSTYRGDKKMLDSLVKECTKRHFEYIRQGNDSERTKSEESKRIAKLEQVLGLEQDPVPDET